jgi:hypothetical protein
MLKGVKRNKGTNNPTKRKVILETFFDFSFLDIYICPIMKIPIKSWKRENKKL